MKHALAIAAIILLFVLLTWSALRRRERGSGIGRGGVQAVRGLAARILATLGVCEVVGYPLRTDAVSNALARCLSNASRSGRLHVAVEVTPETRFCTADTKS